MAVEQITLDTMEYENLLKGINLAFSDYLVPLQLDADSLRRFLHSRDASLGDSFGFTAAGKLVAFVVNAFDLERGLGYNVTTGVVPEHRGAGLASQLLTSSIDRLRGLGCGAYRLEVILGNEKGERLYRTAGFGVRREFVGLDLSVVGEGHGSEPPLEVRPMSPLDLDWACSRLGYEPSWQNDRQSLGRGFDAFEGSVFEADGKPVAALLVHRASGSVPLLVVEEGARGRGIGTAVLRHAMDRSESSTLHFVNLAAHEGAGGIAWLKRRGGVQVWAQNELELALGSC